VKATKLHVEEKEYDESFVLAMISRIDYAILFQAYSSLKVIFKDLLELPPTPPPDLKNAEFLKVLFFAISNVIVDEGLMECPNCHHPYVIKNSIPNMIIRDIDDLGLLLLKFFI
jgi:uncharacterized protein YbaR (Trm112 family)